jgi:hypothetical protein
LKYLNLFTRTPLRVAVKKSDANEKRPHTPLSI